MEKIVWTELALDDLRAIYFYIAEDSRFYADKVTESIFERVTILETHPLIGRVVPEKNDPQLREIMEGNCRIMYSLSHMPQIVIYRIVHHSRLFKD